jgi:heptosyltransferase-2
VRIEPARGLLVRLPNWLGDAVACEPLVRELAQRFERASVGERLVLCAPRRLVELFAASAPRARRLASEDGNSAWRGLGAALLVTGSWRTAWQAFAAGIPVRVGEARDGRAWLLTDAVTPANERGGVPLGLARRGAWPRRAPRPVGTVALELALRLGVSVADTQPRLAAPPEVRERVDGELEALFGRRAFVLVNAGGRAGSAKALAPDEWALALRGMDATLDVAVTCGPGEEARADELVQRLTDLGRRAAFVLGRRAPDLHEYLALLARCTLFVTTDTGPRHLARAVGARSVVLFGPTDPRHTLEGAADELRLVGRADCAPCHRERCLHTGARERECLRRAAERLATQPLA